MAGEYENAQEALKEDNKDIIEKDESFFSKAKETTNRAVHRAGEIAESAKTKFNSAQARVKQYQEEARKKKKAYISNRIANLEKEHEIKQSEARVRTIQEQNRKLDQQGRTSQNERFNRLGGNSSGPSKGMDMSIGGRGMDLSMGGGHAPTMAKSKPMQFFGGGKGTDMSLGGSRAPKPKARSGKSINIKINMPRMK